MTAQMALLPDGRLHLQHGPIDLICRAWGDDGALRKAYVAAAAMFPTILPALCAELALLRKPLREAKSVMVGLDPTIHAVQRGRTQPRAGDAITGAMIAACQPYAAHHITPMAAVAGAVADAVLRAMTEAAPLDRAFVNNGGDIAFHLAPGQTLRCGLVTTLAAPSLDGAFLLTADHPTRGLATSGRACKGRGGRSFSFGIADSVTVLARTAAEADAAATIVANAVDLPGHPAIARRPANDIDPDSDLGARLVTWDVGSLTPNEIHRALDAGRQVADALLQQNRIEGAVLALRGQFATSMPHLPRITAA